MNKSGLYQILQFFSDLKCRETSQQIPPCQYLLKRKGKTRWKSSVWKNKVSLCWRESLWPLIKYTVQYLINGSSVSVTTSIKAVCLLLWCLQVCVNATPRRKDISNVLKEEAAHQSWKGFKTMNEPQDFWNNRQELRSHLHRHGRGGSWFEDKICIGTERFRYLHGTTAKTPNTL